MQEANSETLEGAFRTVPKRLGCIESVERKHQIDAVGGDPKLHHLDLVPHFFGIHGRLFKPETGQRLVQPLKVFGVRSRSPVNRG